MVHDELSTPSARDALNALLATSIVMADDMAKGLADRGLTRARANALWEIAQRGPLTQRQIADLLRVTPRNITKLVDALEETGFAVRTSHETDRRAIIVRLTEKGRAAAERMEAEADALAQTLFGDLPPDEMATMVRALHRVTERLSVM